MRAPSLVLAVLLFKSEVCVAFPWSKNGIIHWLLERQLSNVIAHTESSLGLFDALTSTSSSEPASSSPTYGSLIPISSLRFGIAHTEVAEPTPHRAGPHPVVEHTEDPVTVPLVVTLPNLGGSTAETAHQEQPVPQPTPTKAEQSNVPYIEATITASPGRTPHTEAPTPAPTSGNSKPETGSDSQGGGHGSSQSGNEESSSGDESPDLGAPGSSQPVAPVAHLLPTVPAAVSSGKGTFSLGDTAYTFSAIPGQGSTGISAVVVGSQTATPGQTLTINSQAVVVSAAGSSLYFAPVITGVPQPAPSSVTRVWTEGGKTVTGVFAAPTGTKAQVDNVVSTSSQATVQQAKATAASEVESSGSTASAKPTASTLTTSVVSSSNGGPSSASASPGSSTGDASKTALTISSSLLVTAAGWMLAFLL